MADIFGMIRDGISGFLGYSQGQQQYRLQKQNLDYLKSQEKLTRLREDNAIQRQAADMEKAGLSKTLAAGGGASATTPISSLPDQQANQAYTQAWDRAVDMWQTRAQQMLLGKQIEGQEASNENIKEDTESKKIANDMDRKELGGWDELRSKTNRQLDDAHNKAEKDLEIAKNTIEKQKIEIKLQKVNALSEMDKVLQEVTSGLNVDTKTQLGKAIYDNVMRKNMERINANREISVKEIRRQILSMLPDDLKKEYMRLTDKIIYEENTPQSRGATPAGVKNMNKPRNR